MCPGTITPEEIAVLHAQGVEYIYHPNDGARLGLTGMIDDLIERAVKHRVETTVPARVTIDDEISIGQMLSTLEQGLLPDAELAKRRREWASLARRGASPLGVTRS